MKRPIDVKRDSAGSASIGQENGRIVRMKGIGDRLYTIAERGIVSVQLADQIDPQRTNINIPWSVQRQELGRGFTSPLVAWTLMTAFEIFEPLHLPEGFPVDDAITKALEIAKYLSEIQDSADALMEFQNGIKKQLEAGTLTVSKLPSFPNLRGVCEHAIHLARTVATEIMWLTNVFFPKSNQREIWYKSIHDFILAMDEKNQEIRKSVFELIATIERVNDYRNAYIHPDNSRWIDIYNYELQPNMSIRAPSLEIHHTKSAVARIDAHFFLSELAAGMAFSYEGMLAQMASMKVRQFGPFFTELVSLPEGKERDGSRVGWQTTAPENWRQKS